MELTFAFLRVIFRGSPFLRSSHVLTKVADSADSARLIHYPKHNTRRGGTSAEGPYRHSAHREHIVHKPSVWVTTGGESGPTYIGQPSSEIHRPGFHRRTHHSFTMTQKTLFSMRQRTSSYVTGCVSIRQRTSAYVSMLKSVKKPVQNQFDVNLIKVVSKYVNESAGTKTVRYK